MYALAFTQEAGGGGWPRRPVDWSQAVRQTEHLPTEEDDFAEDLGLSAVRELALVLGLTDDEEPAEFEPA